MILEGLVTTLSAAGEINLAPMGPVVEPDLSRFTLRPFQTSQTYRNLQACGEGVLHVTDDVELIARAALHGLKEVPATNAAVVINGCVLADCCRWFEFRVVALDASRERTEIVCDVVHTGRGREFLGFNRAKHAVLEATILATRLHLLSDADVCAELARLAVLVQKTGGLQEHAAWQFVTDYVKRWQQQSGR